jgi:hypothetical protein
MRPKHKHRLQMMLATLRKLTPDAPDVIFIAGVLAVVGGVAHFSRAIAAIVGGAGLIWLSLILGSARRPPIE